MELSNEKFKEDKNPTLIILQKPQDRLRIINMKIEEIKKNKHTCMEKLQDKLKNSKESLKKCKEDEKYIEEQIRLTLKSKPESTLVPTLVPTLIPTSVPEPTLVPTSVPEPVSTLTRVETTKSVNRQGLKNLGNTCYMNSIIQCLAYTEPLTTYFLNNTWKNHINIQSRCKGLPEIWYDVLINITGRTTSNDTVYKPDDFKKFINDSSNECFNNKFKNYLQHDSSEFLSNLLDGFEESFNEDNNIINEIFNFTSTSTIYCNTCKNKSTQNDRHLFLQLPIEGHTLESCLEKYTEQERLYGENQYNCTIIPGNTHKSTGTKQLLLDIKSKILIISLKRFTHTGNEATGYLQMKINSPVLFPLELNILSNNQEQNFELYATCNHVGRMGGGHYYAYIKDNKEWYEMNDDTVTKSEKFNNNDESAYILFYKRISPSQNQQKYYKDFKALYQKYKSKYLVLKNKLSLI